MKRETIFTFFHFVHAILCTVFFFLFWKLETIHPVVLLAFVVLIVVDIVVLRKRRSIFKPTLPSSAKTMLERLEAVDSELQKIKAKQAATSSPPPRRSPRRKAK